MPVQQSRTGTPGCGGTLRVVNRRQERSIFRLSKWFRKSYRRAIDANIRRTRRSDLSISSRFWQTSEGRSSQVAELKSAAVCDIVFRCEP